MPSCSTSGKTERVPGARHLPGHWVRMVLGTVLCALATTVAAWSDHATLVWPLLRTLPELRVEDVPAETLDAFLRAEAPGLARLLDEQEDWARANLPEYAARPDALRFDPQARSLRESFFAAIRINPTLAYPLYRQTTIDDATTTVQAATLGWGDLSFLASGSSHRDTRYLQIEATAHVSPAHILASASDEPDFGMDIGLFADNGTAFGERYGFGRQSFGNPNLPYGSQAPFHMGFYHLDALTRRAQPDLLRTYPRWRISLYRALAHYAFASGHDYWGWRFSGWALHYIGDLTQPYHAQPLPGISTVQALWLVITGRTPEAIQRVSNRHGVLESYQFLRIREALAARDFTGPLLAAIATPQRGPAYSDDTWLDLLTGDSVAGGPALDRALAEHMPERYVSDPGFEWTGSGLELQLIEAISRERGSAAVPALDAVLLMQMQRFSRYARAWIDDVRAQLRKAPPATLPPSPNATPQLGK